MGRVHRKNRFSNGRDYRRPIRRAVLRTANSVSGTGSRQDPHHSQPGRYRAVPQTRKLLARLLRLDLGCSAKEFLLCFCALGNFETKGLRIAIEALRELGNSKARLVVVGGSDGEIREYEKICQEAQVDTRVRFVGMQQDIRPYLWSSDAFLVPFELRNVPARLFASGGRRLAAHRFARLWRR